MDQEQFALVEIPMEQQMAALKTAHKHANDDEEALMFWRMLGIVTTDEQATCSQCGKPLEATANKLWRDRRGGVCSPCYKRNLKARKAVDE